MQIFKVIRPNLESITRQLLSSLSVRITKSTADYCLQEHPGYPSLLALSDCLSDWKIENQAYLIKREDYDADDLLFPFIAHFKENGGRFVLVKSIENGNVVFADEFKKRWKISEEEFLDRWDGIAQHAEKTAISGEQNYISKYIQNKLNYLIIPGICALFITTFFYLSSFGAFSPENVWIFTVKFIGITVSVLLLIQSIGGNNPFLKKICGIAGKSDCNDVLHSAAAKITPWLSWSEVGFFYFTGTLIMLTIKPSSLNTLSAINIFALPYTFYSVFYQYRSQSWCILCCTVQLVLWSEFLINLVHGSIGLDVTLSSLGYLLLSFSFPVFIWAFLKPFFIKSSQFGALKNQLKNFKYNGELFRKALTSQPRYAVPEDLMPVVFGNPDGKTIVTLISSPYCDPCGKAHQSLKDWAEINKDLQVRLFFKTGGRKNEDKTLFAEHVTAMGVQYKRHYVGQAIHQWYGQSIKKFETWKVDHPVKPDERVKVAVERQKEWCDLVETVYTPTILVNGYKLPDPYDIEDVRYFTNLPG